MKYSNRCEASNATISCFANEAQSPVKENLLTKENKNKFSKNLSSLFNRKHVASYLRVGLFKLHICVVLSSTLVSSV
jgi:hypothetical protein